MNSGLQLAFIQASESHENARKACVSVTLNKGHFDATDFPEGFAHLYEHMLFNASTKYKNADALDNHLFAHHGQVNGWTQDLSTNFQMNCDKDGFTDAFDIFIDRLSAPLFLAEEIEKEIIAIDAEFYSQAKDPVRQLLSVQKASCNQNHPFSVFSTGNNATLGALDTQKTQALLYKYHQQFMQGQHISICIGLLEADETLITQLHNKLEAAFSSAKEKEQASCERKKQTNDLAVYLPSHLNKFIQIEINNGRHQLIVSYIVKNTEIEGLHRNSLYIMLCHLLESKHENGLFHLLKCQNLASDINSYYKSIDQQSDEIVISIVLTEQGALAAQTVYQHVQAYIDYLKQSKIEPWRFREKAGQFSLSLNLNKGSSLLEDCIELSQLMSSTGNSIDLPKLFAAPEPANNNEALTPNENHSKVKPIEINTTLNSESWKSLPILFMQLTCYFVRVYFASPLAKTNKRTEHYDTPYSEHELCIESDHKNTVFPFSKPRQNPYMAGQYRLVTQQVAPHELLHLQSMQCSFKFYQDLRFKLPRGECYISITEPQMYGSMSQFAAKRVWLSCLNEYLATAFFDTELASIHFRVYAHHHGISIHTGGLSERQLLLCIELINEIRQFRASKKLIQRHLQKTLLSMSNKPKQRPINRLFSYLNEFYQADDKKQSAMLLGLKQVSVEEIYAQQTHYFKYNFIETLLIGNWQQATAKRFYSQLNGRFQVLPSVSKPSIYSPEIRSGEHIHETNPSSKDASLVWHYIPLLNTLEEASVANSKSIKLTLSARSLVLEKLLAHTFFDVLRQQQKMGYELGVGYKPISRYPGIAMYAVSQTHSVEDIYRGMQLAITQARGMLVDKTVTIEELVKELVRQVTPRETDISQTASRTWLHFEDKNPILAYTELVDALNSLNKEEIIQALDNLQETNRGQILLTCCANVTTIPRFEQVSQREQ